MSFIRPPDATTSKQQMTHQGVKKLAHPTEHDGALRRDVEVVSASSLQFLLLIDVQLRCLTGGF